MASEKPQDPFQLNGKVALISGGARGLGFAIAEALVGAGACVVLGDILENEGKASAAKLGDKAAFVKLNVTHEADWEAACAATVKLFGGLDIVCNNAGIEHTALFENCDENDFRRVQEINVHGVFLGTKHAIRTMKPGGLSGRGGSIINSSSGAGFKGAVAMGAYCTSKGAVRLLTKAAAVECGRLNYGIRANSIHPGMIKTDMAVGVMQGFVDAGLMPDLATTEAAFTQAHLLGLGKPQDIGNAVRFLASDASSWMTGVELPVDGGYLAA